MPVVSKVAKSAFYTKMIVLKLKMDAKRQNFPHDGARAHEGGQC